MEFTVDIQFLINISLGAFLAFMGFIIKRAINVIDALEANVRKIEVELPTIYARKEEVKEGFAKLESILNRMFEKLDDKMDKR